MRILQIIDSLDAGGAERMAVSYANALAKEVDFSGLVSTRKEGPLFNQISKKVSYLYLNKKGIIDLKALFALRKFAIDNKVEIVHAHSTSFFIAILLKLICPKVKIIWHEHYGARINQERTENLVLFFCSFFFSYVFVVNPQLENWVRKELMTNKVSYVPNFAVSDGNHSNLTLLKGNSNKRIICLANLKNPKNHLALLSAFKEIKLYDLGWSLHLVGKDYNDEYSNDLKNFIKNNALHNSIFFYDSQNDIQNILLQATIGVLCSTDEGFPVSLLEYGLAKLAVVSTNVGYCSNIIKDNFSGLLFDPLINNEIQKQLQKMTLDSAQREVFAINLNELVLNEYSLEKGIQLLISKYNVL